MALKNEKYIASTALDYQRFTCLLNQHYPASSFCLNQLLSGWKPPFAPHSQSFTCTLQPSSTHSTSRTQQPNTLQKPTMRHKAAIPRLAYPSSTGEFLSVFHHSPDIPNHKSARQCIHPAVIYPEGRASALQVLSKEVRMRSLKSGWTVHSVRLPCLKFARAFLTRCDE